MGAETGPRQDIAGGLILQFESNQGLGKPTDPKQPTRKPVTNKIPQGFSPNGIRRSVREPVRRQGK